MSKSAIYFHKEEHYGSNLTTQGDVDRIYSAPYTLSKEDELVFYVEVEERMAKALETKGYKLKNVLWGSKLVTYTKE